MKQSEKSKRTYDRILKAAILEFGTKSYEGASLNTVCNDNNISKGLIYHNFKNKEELYLCTVKSCFESMIAFLSTVNYKPHDFRGNLKGFLDMRIQFFHENPHYSHIFFQAILQPPINLTNEIKSLKRELDLFTGNEFAKIIQDANLRDEISEADALQYFIFFQEMFNGIFQGKATNDSNFISLVEEHELKLSKMIDMMLYGIMKEDTNHVPSIH